MDHAAYHVVYVDSRLSQGMDGRHLQKTSRVSTDTGERQQDLSWEDYNPECMKAIIGEIEEVRTNLKRLLGQFNGGKRPCPLLQPSSSTPFIGAQVHAMKPWLTCCSLYVYM